MRFLPIAVVALALSGCATAQVGEAQGLAAAWSSLDAAAKVIDNLAVTGVLHGKNAAMAAQDLQTASTVLQAAQVAYAAGDASTVTGDITQATTLIAQIIIISKNPGA